MLKVFQLVLRCIFSTYKLTKNDKNNLYGEKQGYPNYIISLDERITIKPELINFLNFFISVYLG